MTKNTNRKVSPRREPPQIAIEWMDLTIDIKVCGVDLPPEERGFVRLFPNFDPSLLSSDVLDSRRAIQKERKKQERAGRYTYLPLSASGSSARPSPAQSVEEGSVKMLPKLTCQHCGKNFSRRSTLEQHMVVHSINSGGQSWVEVQDAAIKDLEQAIAFSSIDSTNPGVGPRVAQPTGEEEEEISPPPGMKEEPELGEEADTKMEGEGERHKCDCCNKSFSRLSLLNRHMKLHSGIKPYSCTICGWRFLQRYNLKKHMWTHSGVKPNKCGECDASFIDGLQLRNHVIKHHNQVAGLQDNGLQVAGLQDNGLQDSSGLQDDGRAQMMQALKAGLENGKLGPLPISTGPASGPVQCTKCDRTFAAKAHLERHMPVHTTMVKPYSCVVCGWRFHLLHNMQRHLATHKGTGGKGAVKSEEKIEPEEIKTEVDPDELSVSLTDQ